MQKMFKMTLFGLCVLIKVTHAMTTPTPPCPSKPETTPQKLEKENTAAQATPLSAAERFVAGAATTRRPSSRSKCLTLACKTMQKEAERSLSPERANRLLGIATNAQVVIVEKALRSPIVPESADFHRTVTPRLYSNALNTVFTGLSRLGGSIHPIDIDHIIAGDRNGGAHFLFSVPEYANFYANSTALGIPPLENSINGVKYGIEQLTSRTHNKTVLLAYEKSFDENALMKFINEIIENPTSLHHQSHIFNICSGKFPLEIYLRDGKVVSAYPIYSYFEWTPGQTQLTVAPIIQNGRDITITMSSDDLLNVAIAALNTYNHTDQRNNPIRYFNRAKNTIVVDLARELQKRNLTIIETGIYVEFPAIHFDIFMLLNKFPEFFLI